MRRPALLIVGLVLSLSVGRSLGAVPLRIRSELVMGGAAGDLGKATVRLLPQTPGGGREPVSALLPLPGEIVLEIPAGETWQVSAEAPGLWSAPQWIASAPGSEQGVSLRFFPAATAVGLLKPAAGKTLPSSLEVRIEASPAASLPRPPLTSLSCPVAVGTFRCSLPAGRLDLRLRAAGFIPVYLWDVAVQAGAERALGEIALREGASVVGWVRAPVDERGAAAQVRLEPQTLGLPADRAAVEGLGALALETRTNERGFFQFQGAPPGTAVVSVTQEGFAATKRSGIEVRPGLESQIQEPFLLSRPLALQVTLDPPTSPSGEPWRLTLERRDGHELLPEGPAYRGAASLEGIWQQKGLSPGHYAVSVGDGETRWLAETVELRPDQTTFRFSLEGVQLVGRVRIGRDPLQATLWFGGRGAARRARFSSDEKGRFQGLLPAEGTWEVEIAAESAGLRLRLDPVAVRKRPGKSFAEVDLQVPNTRLRGRVLDERGNPVPRASLFLLSPQKRSSSATADEHGEFEVRGLAPGPFYVHAEEGDRESEWGEARVEEDRETPELRLVLRTRLVVSGRVYSANGPVPGAEVDIRSALGESGAGSADHAVTGPAGEFTVKLPAGSQIAHVAVLAPGYAIRMLAVPLGSPPILEIPLDPVGGTLVFDLGALSVDEALRSRAGLLAHGGSFIPLGAAISWARLLRVEPQDPHRLVLPNMEIGEYLLCLGAEAQTAIPRGQQPPAYQCSRGSLAPLGELMLPLPAAPLPPKSPPVAAPGVGAPVRREGVSAFTSGGSESGVHYRAGE